MKTGSDDNSLLFITLANLPSKPKPIPKAECPDVTMWDKDDYRDWRKAHKRQAGATDGNSSTSETNGGQRRKEFTHPYLQNKDGTLVADLSDMSAKVRSVWETLKKRGMAPKTFSKISSEAWEFITRVVLPLPEYEFLLYCKDGEWKLWEWCKNNYSSWTRNCDIRAPPVAARKTEDADSILNGSKLLRMETPDSEGDNSVDNIGSKTGGDDLDEDDNDDEEDDDEDMPPPPEGQMVCRCLE